MEYNRSPKAEIIRCVQKDLNYTNELSADFSEILQIVKPRSWIRYSHLCNLFSEIIYHGFATVNNLQTLGEEYTGILQVDNDKISIPSKLIRLIAIIFEFGGERLYIKLLCQLEKQVLENGEILPEAKSKITFLINIMKSSLSYTKGFHKGYFYFSKNNSKYHISKRIAGIQYIHVRNWLKPDYSLYGYKLLGALTFLQLTTMIFSKLYTAFNTNESNVSRSSLITSKDSSLIHKEETNFEKSKCTLCLEHRKYSSVTPCGHLFCWECILEWLDEKDECPLCRDKISKSSIIPLQNYK